MKRIRLPLFWKFAIVMTTIIMIFGSINVYILWSSVYKSFENEIDKRCKVLAEIISGKVLNPLVYGDVLNLYNILDELKQSDSTIAYIFLLDKSNKLVAQTYNVNISKNLVEINSLNSGDLNIKVFETKNFNHQVIRDIAYPIVNGEIGTVRLGIAEDNIRQELIIATRNLLLMIGLFFIIGLIGAWSFAYLITSPIKEVGLMAQEIDLNSIGSEGFVLKQRRKNILSFKSFDELDFLVSKFSEMILRLKKSYNELKETQRSLIQAEKLASLGTLSAGIAHEINNPLSGMQNCVNRIVKNPEKVEQNAKYAGLIKEALDRIESVVQRLLNFSRKQDLKFEDVNLIKALESSILLASLKLKNNNIAIIRDYMDGSFFIKGSNNHLEQVFLNLLLNSSDAIMGKMLESPDLQGEIIIKLNTSDNKVIIVVQDNGKGIPEHIRDHVFDPFFTSKEVGKGTGLGLSVSYNLIMEHHGNIYFRSDENKGTEFIIELPVN